MRRHVSEYIQNRDKGIPSNADDIVLSGGASEGIRVWSINIHSPNEKSVGIFNRPSSSREFNANYKFNSNPCRIDCLKAFIMFVNLGLLEIIQRKW